MSSPSAAYITVVARAIKLAMARGGTWEEVARVAIVAMNEHVAKELSKQMRELETRTIYGGNYVVSKNLSD